MLGDVGALVLRGGYGVDGDQEGRGEGELFAEIDEGFES